MVQLFSKSVKGQSQAKQKSLARIFDKIQEANEERQLHHTTWDENHKRFLGDHWIKNGQSVTKLSGLTYGVINRTQNSTMAHAAVQAEQRPRIHFVSREQHEPSDWFIRPAAGERLLDHINKKIAGAPEGLDERQIAGQAPISDLMAVEQMRAFTQPWMDGEGNERAPLFKDEDIIEVNDSMAANVVQSIHDIFWDQSNSSDWLWDTGIKRNILGTQPSFYEFDPDTYKDRIKSVHLKNVWIDPLAESIEDAEYVIMVQIISKEAAKKMYPKYASAIDEYKGAATNNFSGLAAGGHSLEVGSPYRDQTFKRDMIAMWTAWERYEKFYKYSPQEAVELGKVALLDNPNVDEVTGQPPEGEASKSWFLMSKDGSIGDQTHPSKGSWPQRRGVSETRIIADRIVDEHECVYHDIPVLWSKNIPEIYRPYGQGEPERMKHVDDLINRLVSAFVDYVRYFRSPQEIIPASVKRDMKCQKMFVRPNRQIVMSDKKFENMVRLMGGNLSFTQTPPPLASGFIALWDRLLAEHDRLSGNVDALQGMPPGKGSSGVAIENLQTAARGVVSYKAQHEERILRRLARLRIHAIADFLPIHQWHRYIKKYPIPVLKHVLGRRSVKDLDMDIQVEVVKGSGSTRRFQQLQAMELRRMADISRKGLYEMMDMPNGKIENQRILEEQGVVPPSDGQVAQAPLPQKEEQDRLLERPGEGVPSPADRREAQLTVGPT